MSNRLSRETSPYLLQHADNPVDWYPWGEEALARAQLEDKLIFLSVGYSACHWCHVMAHESFEDEAIAQILGEHFVSIKVDREERPDIDSIYMSAVQALTGRGGWPMSVFLTPDGRPFYGGTYYPPESRYGMPSFADVLRSVAAAWQTRRDELLAGGERVLDAVRAGQETKATGSARALVSAASLEAAYRGLAAAFDSRHGGWGGAPKFPQPMALEFLLRYHHATADERALSMVARTLGAMARGGMYDQMGGGFHRYSVDERWLVPHFEKMLYDNAQLARVYLHAWQATGEEFFRTITEEVLDYVVREMTDPDGGFYSTQDADSEGEEGKFFIWAQDEIRRVLGDSSAEFSAAYGVTDRGNFEGMNILEYVGDLDRRPVLAEARRKLFVSREKRVHPGRDEKVITSWNGLMLAAFSEAARALDRDDYRGVAERTAGFLVNELRQENGRLLRVWKAGEARLNGYLEDYAYLIEGLLELYQTTFDAHWYGAAQELSEAVIAHFQTPDGGFFDTSDDHEALVTRPRDLQDNATPSGSSMAATVLLKLASLSGDQRYRDEAIRALTQVLPLAIKYPLGFGQWLTALDYATARVVEIALVGETGSDAMSGLLAVCQAGYRPHQVVASGTGGADAPIPLLRGRAQVGGQATAYVCVDFTCRRPITEPAELALVLDD